jgi:hypothetical protein
MSQKGRPSGVRYVTQRAFDAAETLIQLAAPTPLAATWNYMVIHCMVPKERRAPSEIEEKLLRRLVDDCKSGKFQVSFGPDMEVNSVRLFAALKINNIISPDGQCLYVARARVQSILCS